MNRASSRPRKITLLILSAAILLALAIQPVSSLGIDSARAAPRGAAGLPLQSSPIALVGDLLANVNPDSNSVSFFNAGTDTPPKLVEIPVGRDPRSVAIQP